MAKMPRRVVFGHRFCLLTVITLTWAFTLICVSGLLSNSGPNDAFLVKSNTSKNLSAQLFVHIKNLGHQEWANIKSSLRILNQERPLCPEIPPELKGPIDVSQSPPGFFPEVFNESAFISPESRNLSEFLSGIKMGGEWSPAGCEARHRLAVIVPYRDRLANLNAFLYHMHPILKRQGVAYRVFVVEQVGGGIFNKGIIMNTGFVQAFRLFNLSTNISDYYELIMANRSKPVMFPFDCFVFHDVDLLPEDDRIMYSCPAKRPRHLSVAIDKFNYQMPYNTLIGGVLNFKTSDFIRANGYSNEYWGWGAEDDDMEARLKATGIGFERPSTKIARYQMLKHNHGLINPKRYELLQIAPNRYRADGLNSLKSNVTEMRLFRLFTHIRVDVGEPPKPSQSVNEPQTLSNQEKTLLVKILSEVFNNRSYTVNELDNLKRLLSRFQS